jgi:glycerate 2-kinase
VKIAGGESTGNVHGSGKGGRNQEFALAASLGIDPGAHLSRNDAYPFFEALGDLVVTGATGTNVADLAIGLATTVTR